jgi:RecA-family ATPase
MHMSSVDLTQPSEVEAFVKDLADVPRHALIVFDFLAANSGTSDEDAAGMNSVCDGAERISRATGASVILVHHTGEDPSKGPRGDNVLVSRAGILLRVDKMKNNDFLLTVEESRDGPKGKQWCFELVPHVIDDKQNQAMTVRNTPAPHR